MMTNDERESPRKAIRNWLSHIDKVRSARRSACEDQSGGGSDGYRSPQRPIRRQGPTNQVVNRHSRTTGVESVQSPKGNDVATPSKRSEYDKSLADRLNLQAPFRIFGDDVDQYNTEVNGGLRCRKRKHNSSSELGFLEPALCLQPSRQRHHQHPKASEPSGARRKTDYSESHSSSGSDSSQASSITFTSPEKPVKTYERRSRHKTKEERYDLKQSKADRKAKKKHEDGSKKNKKKKSKRKEKPTVAMMHSFSAPNVAPDRLTMRPSVTLGLFGKGRASSPVRRRGLPDLAFSEMTFLSTRRGKPDDQVKVTPKNKRRKKDKRSNIEAEMSRFFTSKTIPGHEKAQDRNERIERFLGSNAAEPEAQRRADRLPTSSLAILPPIDLPGRPFLGFGSRGEDLTSPVKENIHEARLERRALTPQFLSSASRSTSYFSWSQSAALSIRRRRDTSQPAPTRSGGTLNEPPIPPKLISELLPCYQPRRDGPTIHSHTGNTQISPIFNQELPPKFVRETTTGEPKPEAPTEIRHPLPPPGQTQKTVIPDSGKADSGDQTNLRSTTDHLIRPPDPPDAVFEDLLRSCRPYVKDMSQSVGYEQRALSHATPTEPNGNDSLAQRQTASRDCQFQAPSQDTSLRPFSYVLPVGTIDMNSPFTPSFLEDAGKDSGRLIDMGNPITARPTPRAYQSDWPCSNKKFTRNVDYLAVSGTDSNTAQHGYDVVYERQVQGSIPGDDRVYCDGPLASRKIPWPTDQMLTGPHHGFQRQGRNDYSEGLIFDNAQDFSGSSRGGLLDRGSYEPFYPSMEDSFLDQAGFASPQGLLEPVETTLDRIQHNSPVMDTEYQEERPMAWKHLDASNVTPFRTPLHADNGVQAATPIDRSLSWRTPTTNRSDEHRFPALIRATLDRSNDDMPMETFWRPNKLY